MHVIGTAGHVDHGKSTLVEALTGINPDRLKEERERQMTIDLGFAWLTLPGGETVGVIDVPGHRDFIENMLAGVGGIDAALFVVAADEGVMPQTREHLAILDLLQIHSGVLALTKSDLVDAEWLELVKADLAVAVQGTALAGAPMVPVSARTGAGLPEVKAALQACLAHRDQLATLSFAGSPAGKTLLIIPLFLLLDLPAVELPIHARRGSVRRLVRAPIHRVNAPQHETKQKHHIG